MKINQSQAESIIKSLVDLIYDDIYIFDNSGDLLASNRKVIADRYLEFGRTVAENNKILVVDETGVDEKCIVTPVNLEHSLVAVICLSGNFQNISKYGEIIVRVTEIILREAIIYEKRIRSKQNNSIFLSKLLHKQIDDKEIKSSAILLGFDVENFSYIALVEVSTLNENKIAYDQVVDYLVNIVNPKDLVSTYENNIVVLFYDETNENILYKIKDLITKLNYKYNAKVVVGLSEKIVAPTEFNGAFNKVKKLLQLPSIRSSSGIFNVSEYYLELILAEVDRKASDEFSKRVLGNLSEEEIVSAYNLLDAYMTNNTSITTTSKALFIHKNTLQYKLNRLRDKTGYNPRNTKDLFVLFTGLTLHTQK